MAFEKLTAGEAVTLSLIGFAIVFAVLIALMIVIKIITSATERKQVETIGATIGSPMDDDNRPVMHTTANPNECDLNNVAEKDAAMIMAIVADQTKIPLNELYFKSIKEVEK